MAKILYKARLSLAANIIGYKSKNPLIAVKTSNGFSINKRVNRTKWK